MSGGTRSTGISHKTVAISAAGLAVLLGALDTYVVVSIFSDLMRSTGISVTEVQRLTPIVTGYLLGYIAAMPLLGQTSDRFGRRSVLQLCLIGFAVGSVLTASAGASWSPLTGNADALLVLVSGRVLQGAASGALLPVTLALVADLWDQRDRASVLGWVGAAQELGSVLGPIYGIFCLWLFGSSGDDAWRGIFWVNLPLAALAMVLVQVSVPKKAPDEGPRAKVDIVGGLLLAIVLGLVVYGLYNPNMGPGADPDAAQRILAPHGAPALGAAGVALVLFLLWERYAKTTLIDNTGVRWRPFLAALVASLAAGAALMVTLVNVELLGQGVLRLSQPKSVQLLAWFLIALPVGAVVGGFVSTRVDRLRGGARGDALVGFVGLLIAAFGYWLISRWPQDLLNARHDWGFVTVPMLHSDLIVAGFGLGLVIGPLSAAALRAVPATSHGVASSGVVVARMTGMLIGVSAFTAWGLYRLNELYAQVLASAMPQGGDASPQAIALQAANSMVTAYHLEYSEIFQLTAVVCVFGAIAAAFVGGSPKTEPACPPTPAEHDSKHAAPIL